MTARWQNVERISPWLVTPAQARAMDAICEHGCHKLAARALGLSGKTIEQHSADVGNSMGARNIRKYLLWDRWRSGANASVVTTSGAASRGSTASK